MRFRIRFQSILNTGLVGAAVAMAGTVWADPPPWTPDYGQRATKASQISYSASYQQFDQSAYADSTRKYGVAQSTCDRDAVRSLITGEVTGDAAAAGSIQGTLVGMAIGETMDQVDQYCIGQALERADDYQAVSWTNPDTGARYNVAATGIYQSGGEFCRGYVTRMILGDTIDVVEGQACRQPNGVWRKVS